MPESASERKRKRLEAWRNRQQASAPVPAAKVSISLGGAANKLKHKHSTNPRPRQTALVKPSVANPFFADDEHDDDDDSGVFASRRKNIPKLTLDTIRDEPAMTATEASHDNKPPPRKRQKKGRWDKAPSQREPSKSNTTNTVDDALDQFMEQLEAGALGNVTTQRKDDAACGNLDPPTSLKINVSGSMMPSKQQQMSQHSAANVVSGGVITPEELDRLTSSIHKKNKHKKATDNMEVDDDDANANDHDNTNEGPRYTHSDWESDAAKSEPETDDEEEEKARRAFIEALKSAPPFAVGEHSDDEEANKKPELAAEVKSEKQRREQRLKELEAQAGEARALALKSGAPEFGRLFNDAEGGVMEEAERNLDAAMAAPDALTVLAELNKKKELKAVDHSKMDYMPFEKNVYIVPRALANLSNDGVVDLRAKLKVRVRGHRAPAPVTSFEQCGLSEKILNMLQKQNITKPFPVQAQCIPCIMAGRDVIGIAKTGSGKTLAYLLPMLRHIGVQPPLAPNESGPIGLILAPARELAYQIHIVCKQFAKNLGLKSTAVYGGAAVAEQIADLKRGAHIVVATPGRMIDILTMQSGKILSLERVTYIVMDEADRMFDMGFAPQISAIIDAVRPDRQTVLFSATFPKVVETLARKALKYPLEVIVGGRSVASDNVTQYAEVVEENEKFLRLLQILGEYVEGTKKVIVFLDTQVRTDNLFEQLLRSGYSSLSLHGGKDQEDRDSTIADFKRKDGPNVLVATGVAGRGLDVPSCCCVINYSAPNHLEAYVHQVGRTGRARTKGVAYTFVNSTNEAQFAPIVVRAMSEAGQSENVSPELKKLSDEYNEKVEKGEAKWAGSGFKGKGYSYDASELSETQKMARAEKRQALIEAGMLDPDEEEEATSDIHGNNNNNNEKDRSKTEKKPELPDIGPGEMQTKLTPELLALPGMHDLILAKAGIIKDPDDASKRDPSLGHPVQMGPNHFLQEFEINDYPREARWKVTQRETTSRLQDEFQTAVTLKGKYFDSNSTPGDGERKLYLHLEATSERILQNCVMEIQRLLNEETLRVGARGMGGGSSSHKYNVL